MYQNYQSKKKSILMVILLTIITCGIYSLFWLYQTTQDLTEYSEDYRLTPGMSVLLTIITCGLYQIYWWYRIADIFYHCTGKTKFPRINDNKSVVCCLSDFWFGHYQYGHFTIGYESSVGSLQILQSQSVTQDTDDWTDY